jgi:hypothetical protein
MRMRTDPFFILVLSSGGVGYEVSHTYDVVFFHILRVYRSIALYYKHSSYYRVFCLNLNLL